MQQTGDHKENKLIDRGIYNLKVGELQADGRCNKR